MSTTIMKVKEEDGEEGSVRYGEGQCMDVSDTCSIIPGCTVDGTPV